MSKTIGILYRAKRVLNVDSLKQIYNTLILPYFNYCTLIWGKASYCYLQLVIRAHKKIVRIITFSHFLEHTAPLFSQLNIMSLDTLYTYQAAIFMFKYYSHSLPSTLHNWFDTNRATHSYNTRHINVLYPTFTRTTRVKSHIRTQGPLIWNQIPEGIKTNRNIHTFKHNLRTYLLNIQ